MECSDEIDHSHLTPVRPPQSNTIIDRSGQAYWTFRGQAFTSLAPDGVAITSNPDPAEDP
jgi:hypothetical protein